MGVEVISPLNTWQACQGGIDCQMDSEFEHLGKTEKKSLDTGFFSATALV